MQLYLRDLHVEGAKRHLSRLALALLSEDTPWSTPYGP